MAYAWQTIEEAAVTLKISTRTIHRRIAGGELETRLDNGRREVMVCLPDEPLPETEYANVPADTKQNEPTNPPACYENAVRDHVPAMADANTQAALMITEDRFRRAEMALTAYQHSLTVAENAVRRACAGTCFAWITTSVLVVLIVLATAWTTHRVTRASADMERLHADVQRLADTADTRTRELLQARREKEEAKIAAARSEGQLQARAATAAATTRPTTLLQRILTSFASNKD